MFFEIVVVMLLIVIGRYLHPFGLVPDVACIVVEGHLVSYGLSYGPIGYSAIRVGLIGVGFYMMLYAVYLE